jgi:hypothetical protein
MTDPRADLRAYREHAAGVGDRLRATEEAARALAEAEERRAAAYASAEEELARLEALEARAEGIWRELTTRFGRQATGPLPEPDGPPAGLDAEDLLRDAHRRVREPIDYPKAGQYAWMAGLGFAAAAVVAAVGVALAEALRDTGAVRLAVAAVGVLAGPWIGHLAARTWIGVRTSHEEREVAAQTAVAGAYGGGGVALIGLVLLLIRLVG